MKIFISLFVTFLLPFSLYAQTPKKKYSFKPIIQQREILLNGGAKASLGGKSRVIIKIDLPNNTKSWYYSFSTREDEKSAARLNLGMQLSSIILDPTGLTRSLISTLNVPPGTAPIDIYAFDEQNANLFEIKSDQNGNPLKYAQEGSVSNTKQGIIDIDDFTRGTVYLGLKNPQIWTGVNVSIEVVALVEEQTEEQSEATILANLGWKAFERGDYDKCIELSKESLLLDSDLSFVHFNLGITYLLKEKYVEATKEYTKGIAVTKNTEIAKPILTAAIKDIKDNMNKLKSKEIAEDILDLIEGELKNY
jgi:tetratricopeptide (TPR) repeat protein